MSRTMFGMLYCKVATNRKSQVVPNSDIRWPGAATGGPRPARQCVLATLRYICRTSKVVPALRYEVETTVARRGSGGRRAGTAVSDGHLDILVFRKKPGRDIIG